MEATSEFAAARPAAPSAVESEVIELFDQMRSPLLRYVMTIGLAAEDGEEVIQDVFLALFQHLRSGKSRENLRGWLFRVAHNLALKQRQKKGTTESHDAGADRQLDPDPTPEEAMAESQRRQALLAVVRALPEKERCCLHLRAEGLRYRQIAEVLGISLGAVSIALTRALGKLMRADGA